MPQATKGQGVPRQGAPEGVQEGGRPGRAVPRAGVTRVARAVAWALLLGGPVLGLKLRGRPPGSLHDFTPELVICK